MNQINYNPDVLTCLANLSNDEVFTPPNLANDMLDLLPQELFRDPQTRFLDPVSKSGIFLREIAKRLLKGLEQVILDEQKRRDHIFRNQLYGIGITELTALLSRRSVYCSKTANSKYSVCKTFDNEQGNIRYERMFHTWENKKCIYCGASQGVYDREDTDETYAYNFIHTKKPEELFDMKFNVIIGNPPYQLSDGGSGTGISAKPLYHKFVEQAKKLNPKYLVMIIPSRWFAGGKGLNEFRDEMIKDKRMRLINDFASSKDCFPRVNIAGGVCYFLWDKDYKGDCIVINQYRDQKHELKRKLDEFPIFIRNNYAISVIHKILSGNFKSLKDSILTRNPFGFVSSDRGCKTVFKDSIILHSSEGVGYVQRTDVKKNFDVIDRYKVTIGKVVPNNGEVDVTPEMGYKVITTPRILGPGEIHTESYILLSSFDSQECAENFSHYLTLKFPRFLLKQTLTSMNIAKDNFAFVPLVNFSRRWKDEDFYELYNLSQDEINYIESIMRPMNLDNNSTN
jgi:site-specific DNA-methyltransferase (adenine-specific)